MTQNDAALDSSTFDDPALAKARRAAAPARRRRRPPWVGLAVVLVLLAITSVAAWTLKLGILTNMTTVLMYAAVALGWNVLGGYGGYLNFGAGFFFGAGVYTAALLNGSLGWSVWTSLPVAALVAALVALPIGYASLRLRGFYFAIFTISLIALAQVIAFNVPALGGALGLYVDAPAESPRAIAVVLFLGVLALVVLGVLISFTVEHTRFGYCLRAIREDEDAASILGVRTARVKLQALLLGAGLAGIAGAFNAFRLGYVEATGAFNIGFSLDIVLVCVVGGLGIWYGPLIGAVIVVLLEQWLRTTIPGLSLFGASIPAEGGRVVLGLMLIVFALFIPRGVGGVLRRHRGRRLTV